MLLSVQKTISLGQQLEFIYKNQTYILNIKTINQGNIYQTNDGNIIINVVEK